MKNLKNNIYLLLLISIILFSISCPFNDDENTEKNNPGSNTTCNDPIFTWAEVGGDIEFRTNDICYLNGDGHSFWAWGNYEDNTADLKVVVNKISGNLSYGYGVIFNLQDNNNFLTLMIGSRDNTGAYIFGKVVDRKFIALSGIDPTVDPWVEVGDINTGYGVNNTIQIKYTSTNNFELRFNPDENTSDPIILQLNTPPYFTQGKYGYITTTSPYENFPDDPVIVRFNQIIPADLDLPMFQSIISKDIGLKQSRLEFDSGVLE